MADIAVLRCTSLADLMRRDELILIVVMAGPVPAMTIGAATARPSDNGTVIPGMNAIAFTREVRAVFGEPRRMVFSAVRAAILRGAQESARTSG